MELGLVGDVSQARISHAQRETAGPKSSDPTINVSRKSTLRGPVLGPSSHLDSVVANHRVAEVGGPLPLWVQLLCEVSGDFSGAEHCGLAGRPGHGEKESSGPLNKLPK